MSEKHRLIIGIDEAGRGPLAGPITLASFLAAENLKRELVKILGGKIKDSKQFSPEKRYAIYRKLLKLRKDGKILFSASHTSNKIIDEKGISEATKIGIRKSLNLVSKVNTAEIRLDGLLKAPLKFKNQRTIIGGDSKDVFIACASIVAKVRRDRLMCRLAPKYPLFALQIHKGYGTRVHYGLIRKHGLSEIHRTSFCKSVLINPKSQFPNSKQI